MSFATTVPALAASFGCSHTTLIRKELVCRDPALSDLDGQVQRAYSRARVVLSRAGADLLRLSEQSWVRFVSVVCPIVGRAYYDPKECLRGEYIARLRALGLAGQRLGPFLFTRVDLYAVEAAPAESFGRFPGFYVEHVAYPRIDRPRTPVTDAWNARSVRRLSRNHWCGTHGDYDTDYTIGLVSARMISVGWTYSRDCHGMHGGWDVATENFVLRPAPRPLTLQDVFGHSDMWLQVLPGLVWNALGQAGWAPVDFAADEVRREIEGYAIRRERWMFTAQGLTLLFNAYEGGCYACTPPPVTVPWAELGPLLAPDAPVR